MTTASPFYSELLYDSFKTEFELLTAALYSVSPAGFLLNCL